MDIQIPQILFQILNFGVVTGALTFLLFKPVRKMLDERSARVEEAQKAAETTIAEKKNIDALKKQAAKEAEKETAKALEKATEEAAARKKQLIADAKKEALAEYQKKMQEAEEEKMASIARIKKEFNAAVIATAEKVVGKFDQKSHQALISSELDALLKRI